jgi:uncharacterized membrane protein
MSKTIVDKKEIIGGNWTIWDVGANLGLLGGTWIFAVAVFLTVLAYFYSENPHGSWLFLAVLPLWVLGAYCFDKIEDRNEG